MLMPMMLHVLILIAFAVVFIFFWSGVSLLVSLISGWFQLAKFYGYSGSFKGNQWRGQTIRMRGLELYESSVKIGIGDQGLYLAVFQLFRPGHEPLLIPWSDISLKNRDARLNPVKLEIKKTPGIPVHVYGEPAAFLASNLEL